MKLTTSKIITIIIGCMVAGCIGTFASQCISPKFENGMFIINASTTSNEVAMINLVPLMLDQINRTGGA